VTASVHPSLPHPIKLLSPTTSRATRHVAPLCRQTVSALRNPAPFWKCVASPWGWRHWKLDANATVAVYRCGRGSKPGSSCSEDCGQTPGWAVSHPAALLTPQAGDFGTVTAQHACVPPLTSTDCTPEVSHSRSNINMYSCALLTSLSGRGASYRLITVITRFLSVQPLNPATDVDYRAREEVKMHVVTCRVPLFRGRSRMTGVWGEPPRANEMTRRLDEWRVDVGSQWSAHRRFLSNL
jgi:hypothetical protein